MTRFLFRRMFARRPVILDRRRTNRQTLQLIQLESRVMPNNAPVASDDTYSVDEDDVLIIAAPGVLANDSDVDGDSLTPSLVSGPSNGTLTLNSDGSFTYTPNANFNGTDTFTYKVSDGTLDSNVATVTITVNAVNDAPVANDDDVSIDDQTDTNGNVFDNDLDVDEDTLQVLNPGSYTSAVGTLVLNADGSYTFTPQANASGQASFSYVITDGNGGFAHASINVSVTDITPPQVLEVHLHYGPGRFVNILDPTYRRILPWSKIRRVSVVFSEPVSLGQGSLLVTGLNVPRYGIIGFNFNASTNTATWVLNRTVGIDRLRLTLRANRIRDLSNNILGASDILYGVRVLPGDFDGNRVVDNRDVRGVRQAIPASAPPLNKIFADINGDGSVTSQDIEEVNRRLGTRFGRIA